MNFYQIMGYITEWMGVVGLSWIISHSPRFKRPPLGFVYARRDGVIALSLFLVVLVFATITVFASRPVIPDAMPPAPAPAQNLGQAAFLAGISLVPFFAALVYRRQPLKSIGWNPQILVPGLQMGVALAFLSIFLRNRVWDVLSGVEAPVLGLLPLALLIGAAEETIFRGYIQLRLAWWLGKWQGIIITALLFTLWHLPVFASALPAEGVLIQSGLTLAQGLVLGWVMDKSGHVFAPALYRAIAIWVLYLA